MPPDTPSSSNDAETAIGRRGADPDTKSMIQHISVVANTEDSPNPRKDAPPYVASLSPEERERAERALVRKIDLRLLPMIVVIYIMNYLDRNNIVRCLLG